MIIFSVLYLLFLQFSAPMQENCHSNKNMSLTAGDDSINEGPSPTNSLKMKTALFIDTTTTCHTMEPSLLSSPNAGSALSAPQQQVIEETTAAAYNSDTDEDDIIRPYRYKAPNDILKMNWMLWTGRRFLRCLLTQSIPIYLPIHCIPIVLFKRKLLFEQPKTVLWKLFKSNFKSCMFLSSFQTLFIFAIVSGNAMFKNDSPATVAVSGLLAPLSVLFEESNRRKEMMLYCIPRVFEVFSCYGSESNWFTKDHYHNAVLFLFSLSMGALMYYYHRDYKNIKPSIRSLISLVVGY
jgi:hypothetical protein